MSDIFENQVSKDLLKTSVLNLLLLIIINTCHLLKLICLFITVIDQQTTHVRI